MTAEYQIASRLGMALSVPLRGSQRLHLATSFTILSSSSFRIPLREQRTCDIRWMERSEILLRPRKEETANRAGANGRPASPSRSGAGVLSHVVSAGVTLGRLWRVR